MNNTIDNNISFTGKYGLLKRARRICRDRAVSILSMRSEDITPLTKRASIKKINFMNYLVDSYNNHNFERNLQDRENPNFVINIFKKIRRPRPIHEYIIHHFSSSFKFLDRILTNFGNSKKRLNFVKRIYEEIFHSNVNANQDLIADLLESPNSKEYIRHFKKYRSYLILNKDNQGVVKQLDDMYESGTFYGHLYDKTLRNKRIRQNFPLPQTDILNAENFIIYYSPENENLLRCISENFHLSLNMLQNGNDADIMNIIRTTSKENAKLRLALVQAVKNSVYKFSSDKTNIQISELSRLFDRIDNDKNAKRFLAKSLAELEASGLTPKEINEILDNVPSKKLNIFRKNAFRIISLVAPEKRIETLNSQIKNPLFETASIKLLRKEKEKYYGKDRTRFIRHMVVRIRNFFDIIRDKLTKDTPFVPVKKNDTRIAPKVEPKVESKVEPNVISRQNEIKPARDRKSERNAVIENILSFITKKLGAKTFDRQKSVFAAGATKIRLGMLPEIFDSVADTRKADRAVGKLRSNSSNIDVLALYTRINGNNRKLVNYLLKKRNADNTRMFEIKDIIAIIDKAEARIAAEKKANPQYRAVDARRYYNHLYEAKVQQYGKLTRQKYKSAKV